MSLVCQIARNLRLDPAERASLFALEQRPATLFDAGTDIMRFDEPVRTAWLLRRGWAVWYETMPDGRCQIFNFVLPGDIIGLPAAVMELRGRGGSRSYLSDGHFRISALTEVQAVGLDLGVLDGLFNRHPALEVALAISSSIDIAGRLQRHLTSTGRRTARERLANLFLELWSRQQYNRHAPKMEFALPVSQSVIADALGLTSVHVSRMLTQLESEGVLSIRKPPRVVVIHDLSQLHLIAGVAEHRSELEAALN